MAQRVWTECPLPETSQVFTYELLHEFDTQKTTMDGLSSETVGLPICGQTWGLYLSNLSDFCLLCREKKASLAHQAQRYLRMLPHPAFSCWDGGEGCLHDGSTMETHIPAGHVAMSLPEFWWW